MFIHVYRKWKERQPFFVSYLIITNTCSENETGPYFEFILNVFSYKRAEWR